MFLRKILNTPELPSAHLPTSERPVKHLGDDCLHNLDLFQNLLIEMEEIKQFAKTIEQKFEKT